ncbi:MAG: hypothetical protein ACYC5S_01545 [Thiobacillus sp.]
MKLKFLSVTVLSLLLSACAATRPPEGAPASARDCPPANDWLIVEDPARSAARKAPQPDAPERVGSRAAELLDELFRVASLSPEQRRRDLAALETQRRLDDTRRFQLAALLEREDGIEALERSLRTLNSLVEINVHAQTVVDLMKKSVKARIELKQQSARAHELQEKLEQIKALEKSLQQRGAAPKTP